MNIRNWLFLPIALLLLASILGLKSQDNQASASISEKVIAANTLSSEGVFKPAACWFDQTKSTNKHPSHDIECGWFHTAPDVYTNQKSFRLPVIIFRYKREGRHADPLVYLAGGPGSGAWITEEHIKFWKEWYKDNLNLKRDLVLFDQRGSGMSEPAIKCTEFQEAAKQVLLSPKTPKENAEIYRQAALSCKNKLVSQNIPYDQLGTPQSAEDVADLLKALGYQHWNLYGVSYGTRLAIEIESRYPDNVRSLVLDSVYAPNVQLFAEWPNLYKESIERIFNYCKISKECNISSQQLKQQFWKLLYQLQTNPITVRLDTDVASDLQVVTINDETLLSILFDLEYTSGILPQLPTLISSIYNGETELLTHYVERYVSNQFEPSFNDVSFWSVECQDNPSLSIKKPSESDDFKNIKYYLPPSYNLCDVWEPSGQTQPLLSVIRANKSKDKKTKETPKSHLPVLIFSGEDDPITPTEWAISAASYYDNQAYLFTFSGISHSVMDNKPCTKELFYKFLHNPKQRPNADCRSHSETQLTADQEDNDKRSPLDRGKQATYMPIKLENKE